MRVTARMYGGVVRLPVTSSVEAVPVRLAGGGRDGRDSAEVSKRRLVAHPLRVVSDRDEQGCAGQRAEALDRNEVGRGLGDEAGEVLVEVADLLAELLVPPGQAAQGVLDDGKVGVWLAARRPARGRLDQIVQRERPKLLAQVRRRSDKQGAELVSSLRPGLLSAAPGQLQRTNHVDVPLPGLRGGGRGAGEDCSCRGLSVERVALALPSSGTAVGPFDLDDVVSALA